MQALLWIQLILLGGMFGAIGQLARMIVGLKKAGEEAIAVGKSRSDVIEPSRLVISVAIGFTAGAFAALLAKVDLANVSIEQVLAFAGAGYAGADFIEGAMSSVKPAMVTGVAAPDDPTASVG